MEATLRTNSIQAHKREIRVLRAWKAGIFLFVLVAEVIAAYWIVYKDGVVLTDAIARTANAYYVLFLQPHKLASIGFVWNPLPSLVQLLIIPFARFWQPLASSGLAGSIATALFAGANAALLFGYFKKAGLSTVLSLLLVFLYAFNPFIFYYGFNGMSETFFFTSMIICTANFALWMVQRQTGQLVAVGLMLAMAFLVRYETFALALALGLAMLVVVYWVRDIKSPFTNKPARMKWDYAVATGTVLFLPVLYTILMWMFLNWSIMGDALFFLNSAYSNESQSAVALYSGFREMVSNPWVAFVYVLERLIPFFSPFLVITGERMVTKRLTKPDYLILVLFVGIMIGFHYVMLMAQKSFGWLRFYSFVFVFSVAWAPYELTQLKGKVKKWTIALLCVSLLISGVIIPFYFQDSELAKEEHQAFYGGDMTRAGQERELAGIINEKYSGSTILMDSFMTSSVILSMEYPENLITNIADAVFDLAVLSPQKQLIDYVVVPTNLLIGSDGEETNIIGGVGALDAINKEHPKLYAQGEDWADLVYKLPGFKMYKVLQWDQNTADLSALVNSDYSDAILLFDNSTTGMLHKNLENPQNAITLTSKSFEAAVAEPMQYGVEYIIVPRTPVDSSGSRDDILSVYPEFMDAGTEWTELVYEDELYRMYEVIYPEGWVRSTELREDDTETSLAGVVTEELAELAEFMNTTSGRSLLLIDPEQEVMLPSLLEYPESLFDNTSIGFMDAVQAPQQYQVRYLILPAENASGALPEIEKLLPGFYEDGPGQAELVFENRAYRVYESLQSPSPNQGGTELLAAAPAATASMTPAATAKPTARPTATATVKPTATTTASPTKAAAVVPAATARGTQEPDTPGKTVLQVRSSANVRAEDTMDSPVVYIAREGVWYQVLSVSENGWYEIRISEKLTGYVSPRITSNVYSVN